MRPFLVDFLFDADEPVEDDGTVASLDVEDGVEGAVGGRASEEEDAGLIDGWVGFGWLFSVGE